MPRLIGLALCFVALGAGAREPAPQPALPPAISAQAALESSVRSVHARVSEGWARVSAEAFINASPQQALETLADFESHPRFIPALSVSKITQREGDTLRLEQVSRVSAGPLFSRSIRSIKRVEIDRAGLSIASESLPESPSQSRSRLTLSEAPGGCVLRYEASAQSPAWAPNALTERIALSQARDQLSRLLLEIERRKAAAP